MSNNALFPGVDFNSPCDGLVLAIENNYLYPGNSF